MPCEDIRPVGVPQANDYGFETLIHSHYVSRFLSTIHVLEDFTKVAYIFLFLPHEADTPFPAVRGGL